MRKKKYQSFLFYSITRHVDDRLKCVVHSNEKFCSVKTVRIHLLGEPRRPYALLTFESPHCIARMMAFFGLGYALLLLFDVGTG